MSAGSAILLVDAGNTRVKFGWMRADQAVRETDILALGHAELEELPAWLAKLPRVPVAALGVSVAHADVATLVEQTLQQELGVRISWMRSATQAAGLVNRYEHPEQLGNDRWVALVGLSMQCSDVAMLVSFGTATTIDTLGRAPQEPDATAGSSTQADRRSFEGGLILPGFELMRQSLANGTAGLPYALGDSVDFPRTTHSAISSGIAAAQAGAVYRQWRGALEKLGTAPRLYCTGGGWPSVAKEVTNVLARAQADLKLVPQPPTWLEAPVLDGLAALAAQL